MVLIPSICHINPHVLIGSSVETVSLLVLMLQLEMQAEGEDDNQARQGASNGASFDVKGTVLYLVF